MLEMTFCTDVSCQIQDELMNRGFQGGVEAAQNLRSYFVEYLRQKGVNIARDLGVIIYVYADVQELPARYLEQDLPKAPALLKARKWVRKFCQGFNSAHPWSCYDDMSVSPVKKYQLRGE